MSAPTVALGLVTSRADVVIPLGAPNAATLRVDGKPDYVIWSWYGMDFKQKYNYDGSGNFLGTGLPTLVEA